MTTDLNVLRAISERLESEGCCSRKVPFTFSPADLAALGIDLLPSFWESGVGLIMPISGRQSTCIYVFEKLSGAKIKASEDRKMPDACVLVAEEIRRSVQKLEGEIEGGKS